MYCVGPFKRTDCYAFAAKADERAVECRVKVPFAFVSRGDVDDREFLLKMAKNMGVKVVMKSSA